MFNFKYPNHLKVGRVGERVACRFLVKHGFSILDRNYLKKCGEIDIVAKKKGIIHFVEVKSVSRITANIPDARVKDEFMASDNFHFKKIQRLERVIRVYLEEKCIKDYWQMDLITVEMTRGRFKRHIKDIQYIENANVF